MMTHFKVKKPFRVQAEHSNEVKVYLVGDKLSRVSHDYRESLFKDNEGRVTCMFRDFADSHLEIDYPKLRDMEDDDIREYILDLKEENSKLNPNHYDKKCPDFQTVYSNRALIRKAKQCLRDRQRRDMRRITDKMGRV